MNEVARLFEDFDVLRERVAEAVPLDVRDQIDLMFESLTGNLDGYEIKSASGARHGTANGRSDFFGPLGVETQLWSSGSGSGTSKKNELQQCDQLRDLGWHQEQGASSARARLENCPASHRGEVTAPAAFQDAVAVAPVQLQLDGSKRSASASSKGVSLPLHTETESEQQQLGEKENKTKSKIADRCRTLLNWADWQRQELVSSSSSSSTLPGSNNVNIPASAMNIRPRHEHHRGTEMQRRALYEAKLRALDAGAAAASSPSSALRDFDQAFARIHESFAVRLQALDCALKYAENEILASTNPELITSSDVLVRKRIDKALIGAAKIAQKKYFCRAELYEKVALREELKGKMKSMEEQDAEGHRSRSRSDAIVVLTENVLSLLEEENQKQKSMGKMGGTAKQSTATCSFTWGGLPYAEVMLLEYSEQ
eukprot:g19093.t1